MSDMLRLADETAARRRQFALPEAPGLGVEPDPDALDRFRVTP